MTFAYLNNEPPARDPKEAYRRIYTTSMRRYCNHIKHDAAEILRYVRLLYTTPPLDVDSKEEIDNAELALTETLFAVKTAKAEYANRPKE